MALLRGILKKQYRFCLRFSKGTKHLIIVWTPTLLFSSAVDKRWCYYTWELYIWILWTRTHAYVGRFLLIWSGTWDEKTIWRKCVWFSWFLWRQMGGGEDGCGSDDQRWCSVIHKWPISTSASEAWREHYAAEHVCRPVPKGNPHDSGEKHEDDFSDFQSLKKNFKLEIPGPLRKGVGWQEGRHY